MIHCILFIQQDSSPEGRLLTTAVHKKFQDVSKVICPDVESLEKWLERPEDNGELEIYVILTETNAQLEELYSVSTLLDNKKVLIILPDGERLSFLSGFHLWPMSHSSQQSEPFSDVCQVMRKTIDYHNLSERELLTLPT
ncbi:MAG: hypothetical protein K9K79_01380 [Desulfohalobiaceae bacterium]|nr:hypothetical protein [Desulfohalobiaceae bacterium]